MARRENIEVGHHDVTTITTNDDDVVTVS